MRLEGYTFTDPTEKGAIECLFTHGVVNIRGSIAPFSKGDLLTAYSVENRRNLHKRVARRLMSSVGLDGTELFERLRPPNITADPSNLCRSMQRLSVLVGQVQDIHFKMLEIGRIVDHVRGDIPLNTFAIPLSPKDSPGTAFRLHQDSILARGLAYAVQTTTTYWDVWRPFDGSVCDIDLARPDLRFSTKAFDLTIQLQRGGGSAPPNILDSDGEKIFSSYGSNIHRGTYPLEEGPRPGATFFIHDKLA